MEWYILLHIRPTTALMQNVFQNNMISLCFLLTLWFRKCVCSNNLRHATASRAWRIVRLNFERLQREPGNDNVATGFGPQGLLWRFFTLANYRTNYLQRRPEEETLDAASTETIAAPPCPPLLGRLEPKRRCTVDWRPFSASSRALRRRFSCQDFVTAILALGSLL